MDAKKRTDSRKAATYVEHYIDKRRDGQDISDRGKGGVLSQGVTSERSSGLNEALAAQVDERSLSNGDKGDLGAM